MEDIDVLIARVCQNTARAKNCEVLLMKDGSMKRYRKDGKIVMMNCRPLRYDDGREPAFREQDIVKRFYP